MNWLLVRSGAGHSSGRMEPGIPVVECSQLTTVPRAAGGRAAEPGILVVECSRLTTVPRAAGGRAAEPGIPVVEVEPGIPVVGQGSHKLAGCTG